MLKFVQHQHVYQNTDWAALQCWYQQVGKQYYPNIQSKLLTPILPTLPGQTIIALGVPSDDDFLQASHIGQQIYIDANPPLSQQLDLLGNFGQLPIANDAIDVVVIPHLLEFAAYPTVILREVERILTPGGHVVITSFNPFCLWRLNHSLANQWHKISDKLGKLYDRQRPQLDYCWRARWLPPGQLKLWLTPLGIELLNVNQQRWQPTTKQGLNVSLKAYALVAKKHVFTVTPIKPRLQWQGSRAGKLVAAGVPQTQAQNATQQHACIGNLARKINS